MIGIILVLLWVAAEIVKANGWFVIPNMATDVLSGLGFICILTSGFYRVKTYRLTSKKFK